MTDRECDDSKWRVSELRGEELTKVKSAINSKALFSLWESMGAKGTFIYRFIIVFKSHRWHHNAPVRKTNSNIWSEKKFISINSSQFKIVYL